MDVELTDHLGYEHGRSPPGGAGNTRNGTTPKTLHTEHGSVRIDNHATVRAALSQRSCASASVVLRGFDEKIIALYARGMSVRDIEAHLAEIYGVQVGHDLISRVIDAVMNDVRAWQQRPLEDIYPIVFLDCLVITVRDGGSVQCRACYLALGVTLEGRSRRPRDVVSRKRGREVLAAGPQRPQAARRPRHPDRLRRRPQRVPRRDRGRVPKTWVQTCIVHLIRHSLRFVPAPRARAGSARPQTDLHRDRRGQRIGSLSALTSSGASASP